MPLTWQLTAYADVPPALCLLAGRSNGPMFRFFLILQCRSLLSDASQTGSEP